MNGKFQAVEIAYQVPNRRNGYALGPMVTKIVRTQKQLDALLVRLEDKDAAIYGMREVPSEELADRDCADRAYEAHRAGGEVAQ